jgi:high-affinity Fe2+/Pb2+ permease
LALVWACALFCIWPILRHRTVLAHWEWRTRIATILSYVVAAFLGYLFYRTESRRGLDRSRALILVILIFLLTSVVNQIHHSFVDEGAVFGYENNLAWQEGLQIAVVQFNPVAVPHVYRFLPDGIVLWMR